MNHIYRVSVIVPVYNVEDYLESCLKSLINQTINPSEMEVLLINDGSTDGSLEICQQYETVFPFFKVITKENEGLSATRNIGLKKAQGKYIAFLDSDDEFSPQTLKNLCDFFDQHFDEMDCLTYPIHSYKNGKRMKDHFRYNFLKESGVYDLNSDNNIYITQTNINIMVKRESVDHIIFDTREDFHQEDQKYVCDIIKEKQTIGYCSQAEYRYMRREDSITGSMFNPINLFESTQKYFEEMFGQFDGKVPRYYQNMYIHDLQWKLKSNILYPYHYEGKEFENAVNRIKHLLSFVDEDVIMNHPDIDSFHKVYWLKMKPNNHALTIADSEKITIVSNGNIYYERDKVELVLSYLTVINGKVRINLCAKSPAFSFIETPTVFAVINQNNPYEEIMSIYPSSDNYYHCRTETNHFWFFRFEKELNDNLRDVQFEVEVDGVRYKTNYYFMPTCPYNTTYGIYKYAVDNYLIRFDKNVFYFSQISNSEKIEILKATTKQIESHIKSDLPLRKYAQEIKKNNIWLYYDCKGVEMDNGYYQFLKDCKRNDGVDRFYISNNSKEQWKKLFDEEVLKRVISFGSDMHKMLFLNADVILTAFVERENVIPFAVQEEQYYRDLFHYQLIYLQHGILHATLPWKYSPERIEADKIVVSSYFELDNFVNHYHFKESDLIKAGMPRYEYINYSNKKANRILFAPTWRQYLIGKDSQANWKADKAKFIESDYYNKIYKLLNNKELQDLLEQYDYYLDLKLHPIFREYSDCFTISCPRISCEYFSEDIGIYSLFITDFSSWVFDFAFLKTPIIYFVPDMKEFKCGLNTYRNLDLPFEKGFGNMASDPEKVVYWIKGFFDNGFIVPELYEKRMNDFFLPMNNNCDRIYQAI